MWNFHNNSEPTPLNYHVFVIDKVELTINDCVFEWNKFANLIFLHSPDTKYSIDKCVFCDNTFIVISALPQCGFLYPYNGSFSHGAYFILSHPEERSQSSSTTSEDSTTTASTPEGVKDEEISTSTGGLSVGVIVLIVAIVVVLCIGAFLAYWFFVNKRKEKNESESYQL
jgi:hypothetical protein